MCGNSHIHQMLNGTSVSWKIQLKPKSNNDWIVSYQGVAARHGPATPTNFWPNHLQPMWKEDWKFKGDHQGSELHALLEAALALSSAPGAGLPQGTSAGSQSASQTAWMSALHHLSFPSSCSGRYMAGDGLGMKCGGSPDHCPLPCRSGLSWGEQTQVVQGEEAEH